MYVDRECAAAEQQKPEQTDCETNLHSATYTHTFVRLDFAVAAAVVVLTTSFKWDFLMTEIAVSQTSETTK